MKRNTKKKKDFVVFLFLDSWATATASSVVTLSAQIKIWYDIFFTLVLFHSVFVLHSEKKNTPIVWRVTYKHIQILWYYSFSWHFVVCFFSSLHSTAYYYLVAMTSLFSFSVFRGQRAGWWNQLTPISVFRACLWTKRKCFVKNKIHWCLYFSILSFGSNVFIAILLVL